MKLSILKISILASLFIASDSRSESQWDEVLNRLGSQNVACPAFQSDKDVLCEGSVKEVCKLAYQRIYTFSQAQERLRSYLEGQKQYQVLNAPIQTVLDLKAELNKQKPNPKLKRQLIKKYMESIVALERKVFDLSQLQSNDLSKIVENSKQNLIQQLDASTPKSPDYKKKLTLEKVRHLPFSSILKSFDRYESDDLISLISVYIGGCGENGTDTNAFYDSDFNQIVVCPGFLLASLDKKNFTHPSALYFSIGHELGHSVDVGNLGGKYEKVLSCIKANHILPERRTDHFYQTREKLSSQMQDKANQATASSFSSEYWKRIKQSSLKLENKNQRILQKGARKVLITKQDELIGDYYGAKNLAESIHQNQLPESTTSAVLASVAPFCEHGFDDSFLSEVHPSNQIRLEMILGNPKIRKQLGCSATGPQKPGCE